MLITYIQVVTYRKIHKKHHFQNEKYEEKNKRPIKSCEVYEQTRHCKTDKKINSYI